MGYLLERRLPPLRRAKTKIGQQATKFRIRLSYWLKRRILKREFLSHNGAPPASSQPERRALKRHIPPAIHPQALDQDNAPNKSGVGRSHNPRNIPRAAA